VWNSEYVQTRIASLARGAMTTAATAGKAARRAVRARRMERRGAMTLVVVLVLVLAVGILVPCVGMARNFAIEPALMTRGWYQTLQWLRDNTPEPLEADSYYRLYERPPAGGNFPYPDQAWSVMAWWDYGHWITRISHRIPVANPFQEGAKTAARFFLSKSETEGIQMLEALDSHYVITDARTSVLTFHGVVAWGGEERSDYFEAYTQRTSGSGLERIVLYYPAYYQSTLVRLQCLHGQTEQPDTFRVVRYEDSGGLPGAERLIVGLERFDSYEEALAFIEKNGNDHLKLVSSDPLKSCVPLEALDRYSLVFESEETTTLAGHQVPAVRVFQVTGL